MYFAQSPQNTPAASANGAFDCDSTSGGMIPIIAIELIIYTTIVISVPAMVAFFMVEPAFSVCLLAIVALSIPKNANKVKVVVIVMAEKLELPLILIGKK